MIEEPDIPDRWERPPAPPTGTPSEPVISQEEARRAEALHNAVYSPFGDHFLTTEDILERAKRFESYLRAGTTR